MYDIEKFEVLNSQLQGIDSDLPIRIHRAISWMEAANENKIEEGQEESFDENFDEDEKKKRRRKRRQIDSKFFLFSWIAFNAMYGGIMDMSENKKEKSRLNDFFKKIIELEEIDVVEKLWDKNKQVVEDVLESRWLYEPYWSYTESNKKKFLDWEKHFNDEIKIIKNSIKSKNNYLILQILFKRMYVLRNQLLHGNSTYGSYVNKKQIRDCRALIELILPIFLEALLLNPNKDWGNISYTPQN